MFFSSRDANHDPWMSFTDLMSGFLVVFMLAAVFAIGKYKELYEDRDEILSKCDSLQCMVDEYADSLARKEQLKNLIAEYESVFAGYDGDVKVIIDKNEGSIKLTHKDPQKDLFRTGEANMNPCLSSFLDTFGKQMVDKTIALKKQNSDIEFRIEGHTDPKWTFNGGGQSDIDYRYIKNLHLSSARANSVYTYILDNLGLDSEQKSFLQKHMISVGYSFADRIRKETLHGASKKEQEELDAASRRVEFRIIAQ